MARPRSAQVQAVKRRLASRLRDGSLAPGDRFPSNRAVADQFGISYQTADRLVRELVREGLLRRRAASGTYVPGKRRETRGVQLIFHRRAKRKSSFGARLLRELVASLDREQVPRRMTWATPERTPRLTAGWYPVIWEAPHALDAATRQGRAALLLNDRPAPGLAAARVDSVSVDDFSGGACAAQLLARARPRGKRAVLSGPPDDSRSRARVSGFLSVATATVVASPDWFLEGGLAVAGRAVRAGPAGIFCCNDRLAEAVVRHCRRRRTAVPPLVGFDDAPIADWLDLTTIAIPWKELVAAALGVIRRRCAGDTSASITQIVATRPIVRDQGSTQSAEAEIGVTRPRTGGRRKQRRWR